MTEGTWAANELEKFDLQELIFKWDTPSILPMLLKIACDDVIKTKITKMKTSYLSFHNKNNFANRMKLLFKEQLASG